MTPPELTAEQLRLVQRSLTRLLPHTAAFTERFYQRVFELDPSTRPLFKNDLAAQGQKLIDTLDVFAGDFGRWDAVKPAMQRLGARHAEYGVQAHHYQTIGAALLETLAWALGEHHTPALHDAWAALYAAVSREMLSGAPPDSVPPAEK